MLELNLNSNSKKIKKYSVDFFCDNNFHIGFLLYRWNIYMQCFILYKTKNYYVFNIFKLLYNLKRCIFFLINISFNRGNIFMIEANNKYKKFNYLFKQITKQFFLGFQWIGGLMTNFKEFFLLQTKEKDEKDLEVFWIYKRFGYFKSLKRLPDIVIFLNNFSSRLALTEFQILGVPSVSVFNSDANPCGVNFVLTNKKVNLYSYVFYIIIFIESILLGSVFERTYIFKYLKDLYYFKFVLYLRYNSFC
jgi:small subunit ribosomal protein S2